MNELPPLQDMHVFVTVARLGSFSATAQFLGVSPAYVSKRIGLLEKQMAVKLLVRSARHVSLTLEGRIVFERASQLLETVDQMFTEIGTEKIMPRGEIRIAASTGYGSTCIAPIISQLVHQYSELTIDFALLDRPVDVIAEGFDLEIRVGGVLPVHLIAKKLATNYRILCASPAYLEQYSIPTKLKDLENHHCIGIRERDQHFGVWRLEGTKHCEALHPPIHLATNNGQVARQWCLAGHGIMLRSIWSVKEDLQQNRLVRVLPEYKQQADVYALYSSRLSTSAKIRVCVEFLAQHLQP